MTQDRLNTLLIELGTEELPPKALKSLSDSFGKGIQENLSKRGFSFSSAHVYGAPRRLAVSLQSCQRVQDDKEVEKRGPAVSAAFDSDGNPTKAASGWAMANGIEVTQAGRLKTDKGEWLMHKAIVKGQSLEAVIEDVIHSTLKALPIPKAMRWGDSDAEFIRPVHTLTIMYGDEVIPARILDIDSSNSLSGHRFHGAHRFTLDHADDYEQAMMEQFVIADYAKRMDKIESQLKDRASALGLKPDFNEQLLEEISSLVEWPVVLKAKFEEGFLAVPKEALIYTMKDDQKYVPLLTDDGELSSSFLFVSNIESKDPSQVISGNEKVIRPRLSDAEFFFETDKKTTLEAKTAKLKEILFQKSLGSVADRSQRIASTTQSIGLALELDGSTLKHAHRAALLAKADLASEMVMEFPSVQGVMGKHYAIHDGEAIEVAQAIEEQYLPRFANDRLPETKTGMLLSLCEKLDTLVGIFGVYMLPKGDKDPFALRRSAIGILRIIQSFNLNLSIKQVVELVSSEFGALLQNKDTVTQVCAFLSDRLKPFYHDQGINTDVVNAVMAANLSMHEVSIADIHHRVTAVSEFSNSPSASSLIEANKRVANILRKNDVAINTMQEVDAKLFNQAEETALYDKLAEVQLNTAQKDSYSTASSLEYLSGLKQPLDDFFDKVMIMADDEQVKMNRIRLIANVRTLFLSIADISLLNSAS
ncbi:glycine--tRNA ligase subunit beta [Ningiella sp. W23]|uniref:glycine--tRNA ligase subunit beta n=1 Tax=Ningiella sp. W23 TaxID=3023715 RepID=UPI0037568562